MTKTLNWLDGWYQSAEKLPSPNFGPRPMDAHIDLIVLHSISLPPGAYGGTQVHELFINTLDWNAHPYFQSIKGIEVSAHFFVQRTGKIWQYVSCDMRAWHAGSSCHLGRKNCNDFSIGIELEGLEGENFEPTQYLSLQQLCLDIARQYPIQYVAGHEHIAPGRKMDPGPGFNWHQFQEMTGFSSQYFPEEVGIQKKA